MLRTKRWILTFGLALSLPAVAQQAECFSVLNPTGYTGGTSDVFPPGVRVMSMNAGSIVAVKTWYEPTTRLNTTFKKHAQLLRTSDRKNWKYAGQPYGTAPDELIAIAESSNGTALFRGGKDDNAPVERSTDRGKTWKALKFMIDGLALPVWIQKVETTPGATLAPRFAKVLSGNPATIYATFQLSVSKPGKSKEFSFWKDVPGMYVSQDGGDSWSLFSHELVTGSALGVSLSDSRLMVGEVKSGLALSRDGGRSWVPVGQQKELKEAVSMQGYAEAVSSPEVKAVGGPHNTPVRFYQIEIPKDGKLIYIRSNIGLVVSRDEGQSWNICPLGGKVYDKVNAVVVPPDAPHSLLVSTEATGSNVPSQVLYSEDDGHTFKAIFRLLPEMKSARPESENLNPGTGNVGVTFYPPPTKAGK